MTLTTSLSVLLHRRVGQPVIAFVIEPIPPLEYPCPTEPSTSAYIGTEIRRASEQGSRHS